MQATTPPCACVLWLAAGGGVAPTHLSTNDFSVLLCRLDTAMRAASCERRCGAQACSLQRVLLAFERVLRVRAACVCCERVRDATPLTVA